MKRQLMLFALLALVGLVVLLLSPSVMPASSRTDMTVASHDDDDDEDADADDIPERIIRRGFAIAPVPLNPHHKKRALVGLGSYIVNAQGDCNGCHTSDQAHPYLPGGDPYQGQPEKVDPDKYLVGGSNFFANVTSRNLRPDALHGKPAGLTFDEFKLVLRTGIDLDHAHPCISDLLQVMPWPTYGKMTNRDIRAIYEYLKALPPHQGYEVVVVPFPCGP